MKQRSDFIPFVYSSTDVDILRKHYADSSVVRLPLESAPRLVDRLGEYPLWIDPGFDALGRPEVGDSYKRYRLGIGGSFAGD